MILVFALFEQSRLIDLFHFPVFRRGLPLGQYNTVHAKSLGVRIISKIAPVGHLNPSVFERFGQSLIDPVPNKTAQHTGVTVDFVPIFLEIPQGVAHAMHVLAGHNRTIVGGVACYTQKPFPAGILGTFRIGTFGNIRIQVFVLNPGIKTGNNVYCFRILYVALSPFVMNFPAGIKIPYPGGYGRKIRSVARFVTHRPENNAGVIAVAHNHTHSPVHKSGMPIGLAGQEAP
ncbi:MAG: hypothetical protein BWX77_00797 [Bacteroidetes bacterium ADurb.Bin090]|nr:MAG: hypothetical protein BWX77_00797 [Bacteroidetes bacterium ADurb.Bin090]